MKEITLADQVMDSLAFEVEEVPQDGQISSASSNSPLNVKIRIRKKNRKELQDGGIISIPKIDHSENNNEKIRITSSDQTIMSFNVLMERGQFAKKRPPKQKRIMQLFKKGGCLGMQNDEDQYEYSIATSQPPDTENNPLETIDGLSSDSYKEQNFTLAKNFSNTEASQANKYKHTDFLGKCKPGGCLDPPFGEDKYSYLPKFIDVTVADETETKKKIKECECPEDTKIKSKDDDKIYQSPVVKKEKAEPICCSHTSLLQLKNSNSIITFPSILPSTEALDKHQIQRRSKSYSGSRESKSYNLSNQLLETYYISPKIKLLDQERKSITDSNQENLFGESKPASYFNSDLGLNKNDEKVAKNEVANKELVANDILNNDIHGLESTRIPLMEKIDRKPVIMNIMPETGPLNMNDSEIWLDKQNVESINKCLDKGDIVSEVNLKEIPKKSEESIFTKSENVTETIIAIPYDDDLTVDKIDLEEMNGITEVPLTKIAKGTMATSTKSVKNDDFENKSDMEITSLPRDHLAQNESLNAEDGNTNVPPEEINKALLKTETKSRESSVTKNKSSTEIMSASIKDILYDNEDLFTKDALKLFTSMDKHKEDTSNIDIINFTKPIDDDGTKDESINTKVPLKENSSLYKDNLNVEKNAMLGSSPEENASFIGARGSTIIRKNVEGDVSQQDFLHYKEALKGLETAVDTQLRETNQSITLLSKSSTDVLLQDFLHDKDALKDIETAVDNQLQVADRLMKLITKSSADVLLQDSLRDKESQKVKESAMDTQLQEADQSKIIVSKSSQNELTELVDEYGNKLENYEENDNKISDKSSAETDIIEGLKSNAVDPTGLKSSKENESKGDKDKEKEESLHSNKSDVTNSDQLVMQGNQDALNMNNVTNSEVVSEAHVDDDSAIELQALQDQIKSKSGILQDEIYHKDLEVTFSDKIMTERLGTSENILSKPTDIIERLVPHDENKNNYDAKEAIHLNMAFQSFQTDQDGSVIKTINFSSFDDLKRYPNDNILQFQTIIRTNDGEIKIPIDSKKDLVLQIITNQKNKDQHDESLPDKNKHISSKYQTNLFDESINNKGNILTPKDSASTKSRGIKPNEIDLQQTLDDVYNDKLLPLHDIIKRLKSDINELTRQQTLIKEKLYNTKRVQSNPIYTSGKKCGCVEMLFSR